MKTVMKKMFCLLLVAVLLVGVMPFAAFAEGETCEHDRGSAFDCRATKCTKCNADLAPIAEHDRTVANCTTKATCKVCGSETGSVDSSNHDWAPANCTTPKTCKLCGVTEGGVVHDRAAATCTVPSKCTICGSETGSSLGHIEVIDDAVAKTCTTDGKSAGKHCSRCNEVLVAQVTDPALGHQLGSDKVCTVCKECDHCKETINAASDHLDSCPNSTNYKTLCTKCNTEYITVNGHPDCEVCDGCHTTANCPYCSVCWPEDKVTTHKASDHCEKCESLDHDTADHCTKCGKTDGTHKSDCPNYVSSGSSKVKVYVNLYTGDVKTSTKQLVVYYEDSNTSISDTIIEHKALITAELADQYPNYSWSGNVYDSENEDGQNMNDKVGKGITIHINAHSKENLVYLYIHNSRTYDRIGIVRLHGKKVGETVTESEVRKAVKDYYSFSHLSMYDTEKWDDYVDGKTVTPDGTLTVGSSHYVIDVKISGSVKSSSSYTADSTNPKTGDEIFVPMAVLGLSASALAVMFYLNKKRAY